MITKFLRWSYISWSFGWFLLGFILIFPFIFIFIQNPRWHRFYHPLSRFWAILFYTMNGLSLKVHWEFRPNPKQVYIYCPNHFSFMDIPILTRTIPSFFVFVGLHNLKKIPLFGYMYEKIHITIDRSSARDRYRTYQQAKEALSLGKSLVIFPEGGIWSEDFPNLASFKDGAFRIAIEQRVAVVPVTIPFNWKILPVFELSKLRWNRSEIVFHQPISTENLTLKDITRLREEVFAVIQKKLVEYNSPQKNIQ